MSSLTTTLWRLAFFNSYPFPSPLTPCLLPLAFFQRRTLKMAVSVAAVRMKSKRTLCGTLRLHVSEKKADGHFQHSAQWKLFTIDPTTKYHPSAKTKRINLNGSEITTGGNNIMPIDMRMLATTISTIKNGI